VVDLMEALRKSVAASKSGKDDGAKPAKKAAPRKRAAARK
jgi:non-homologous end joining protein Ku